MADNILAVFAGIVIVLAAVTAGLFVAGRRRPGRNLTELVERTKTWWAIVMKNPRFEPRSTTLGYGGAMWKAY